MAFTSSIISCICLSRAVPWNGRCPVLRLSSSVRRIRSSDAAMSRSLYSTSGKNFESHLTLKMCDIRQLLGGADPRPGQDFHEPNQRVGTYFKQAAFLYNPPLVPDPMDYSLGLIARINQIWSQGGRVFIVRMEKLTRIECKDWEESLIRVFSQTYQVSRQLLNKIHGQRVPTYLQDRLRPIYQQINSIQGISAVQRRTEFLNAERDIKEHYSRLGVRRLIKLYQLFLYNQMTHPFDYQLLRGL